MMSADFLEQARQTLEAGNRGRARRILSPLLRDDPHNLEAWILFSRVASTPRAAEWCLSRALEIDPDCEEALQLLEAIPGSGPAGEPGHQPPPVADTLESPAVRTDRPRTPPPRPHPPVTPPEAHPDVAGGRTRGRGREAGHAPASETERAGRTRPKLDTDSTRQLAARLRKSKADTDRLRQREAALTDQVDQGKASLREARTEIQLLRAEVEDLRDEVERLQKADADRELLGERLRSVRRQLAEEAAELEATRRAGENARIELQGLAQIKAERERQLDALVSTNERLSDEIEQKLTQDQALELTLQEAREEARALREVRERLELARGDRDALEENLHSLEQELTAKTEELESTERSLETARSDLDGTEQRHATQQLKLDDLRATDQKLAAEIASKQLSLETLESKLADVREELKELRRERVRVSEPLDGQLAQVVEDAVQSGLKGVPSLFGKSRSSQGPLPSLMMIILVGLGVLLLIVGSILAYPHIVSRLWWLSEAFDAAPAGQVAPASSAAQLPTADSAAAPVSPDDTSREGEGGSSRHADAAEGPTPTAVQSLVDSGDQTPIPDAPPLIAPDATAEPEPSEEMTPTPTPQPAIPTRIVIPRLNLDAPIVPVGWSTQRVGDEEMGIWEVPDERAAGWHDESAPLGEVGNTVLNGHNTTHGEIFRDLYRLEEGDLITLQADDAARRYEVAQSTIFRETGQPLDVRLEHAELLGTTEDERLTLITCHPYGSTANRLVITAFPESTPEEEDRFGG